MRDQPEDPLERTNPRRGEHTERKRRGIKEQHSKRGHEAALGEASLPEARDRKGTIRSALCADQTERGGNLCWDAKQANRHLSSGESARITSQVLGPGETSMSTFGPEKRSGRHGKRSLPRLDLDLYPLASHHLDAGPPMLPT